MKNELSYYTTMDELAPAISSEIASLFPEIGSIALSRLIQFDTESQVRDTVLMTVIGLKENQSVPDTAKIREWLTVRTGEKKIRMMTE